MSPLHSLRTTALALLLACATTVSAHDNSPYVRGLQDALFTYAASDFAAGKARPDSFRKVDLRYRENDFGARTYMLCGQAQINVGGKANWVDFATVKTLGYEQWLGASATDMCTRAILVAPDDLSENLQSALSARPSASKP